MSQRSLYTVRRVVEASPNIFVLSFKAPEIAEAVRPGQFVSVKAEDSNDPLLRRPFSVYWVDGHDVEIIFNVVGRGTTLLRNKRSGERIDVLGPLGVPFRTKDFDAETAILVAGGLGVAPMPLVTAALRKIGTRILTLLGVRSAQQAVEAHLENVRIATDDGSRGFHGTVVELLARLLDEGVPGRLKVFGCGPNAMLRALGDVCTAGRIPCEVSLEGPMGCGFGICQGCPVELVDGDRKYALMCKDGPSFDIRKIRIPAR